MTPIYDIVIANGRVVDPETMLAVGIKNDRIAAISTLALRGQTVVNATGLIVAPRIHRLAPHGQSTLADRMQAFDGVTTTMELEAGMLPIGRWYDQQAGKRVLNYGAASSWAIARISALEGVALPAEPRSVAIFANFTLKKWPNDIATSQQVANILDLVEQGLKEGGIGVGVVPG